MTNLKASVGGLTLHRTKEQPNMHTEYTSGLWRNIEVNFFEADLNKGENRDENGVIESPFFNVAFTIDGEAVMNASIRINELEGFAYSITKMIEMVRRDYGDVIKEQLLKGADI